MPRFHNVYPMHTSLKTIAVDGWCRGFDKQQTLEEASNAGYANCVASLAIDRIWGEWDTGFALHIGESNEWDAGSDCPL